MARTLPAGLTAKISASGQQPTLSLTAQDLQRRLSLYAQGGTPGRSSAIVSSTGKILRAVCRQAAPTNQTVTCQTITAGSPASWTAAPTTVTTNAIANAGCCIVQTAGTTRLFYQRTSDSFICYRDSTDDGLTWGAEQLTVAHVPSGDNMPFCYGLAADTTTSLWGAWAAFDPNGACALARTTLSGTWSAWSDISTTGPAGPFWTFVRGISLFTHAALTRFVGGVGLRGYNSGISAAWFTFDGTHYSDWSYIQELDTQSQGLALSYPHLFYDSSNLYGDGLQWYATVLLTDDGSVSTNGHTRCTIYRSADGQTWQPWLNAGTPFAWGAHTVPLAGTTYLFDATTCYTVPPPPPPIDLSDDVLSISLHEAPNTPATAEIVLSTNTGQYLAAPWLIDNCTLTLSYGYSGQTATTHTLFLDDYSFQANADSLTLTLAARDALKFLDYPSTLLLAYINKTLTQILQALALQGQFTLAPLPATSPLSQTVSCFVITPGETWLSALKRLGNLYALQFQCTATQSVMISDPQATDTSTWSYSSESLATEYGQESNRPNVVRVTGSTVGIATAWSETTDQDNILLVGSERYKLIVDRMLDTSAKCLLRARQELRLIQREATHAQAIVAPNPQHELTDVITATDPGVGMTATRLRIVNLTTTLAPRGTQWQQILTLEAP